MSVENTKVDPEWLVEQRKRDVDVIRREYAKAALTGVLAAGTAASDRRIAEECFEMADAMIEEERKRGMLP